MRTYLAIGNLSRAAGLSALLTLMALGRVAHGQMPLAAYIPLTFLAMLFVGGAVTAWGSCAGMQGVTTDRHTLLRGAAIAAALSLLAVPVYLFGVDPGVRELFSEPRYAAMLELTLPSTLGGRVSLMLWSASFQTVVLVAAPMSVFARISNRRWLALVLCICLRAYVVSRQLAYAGIAEGAPLFFAAALLSTAAACYLFARFGLVPAMLLSAGLDLHVFLLPP